MVRLENMPTYVIPEDRIINIFDILFKQDSTVESFIVFSNTIIGLSKLLFFNSINKIAL